MDPITAQTLIHVKEHYEKLLTQTKAELAEEKKKGHMYMMMTGCYSDIYRESQPGVCAECDHLCFSVTRAEIDHETGDEIDFYNQYSYKTCQKCKELTCTVCCDEIAWGIDYSTDDYDCGKCPKCIVLDGGSTVVRD